MCCPNKKKMNLKESNEQTYFDLPCPRHWQACSCKLSPSNPAPSSVYRIVNHCLLYRTQVRSLPCLVTKSLTPCSCLDLTNVTLACEDSRNLSTLQAVVSFDSYVVDARRKQEPCCWCLNKKKSCWCQNKKKDHCGKTVTHPILSPFQTIYVHKK